MRKINFYGGPGSGKSTVASVLYSDLKILQYTTELVREAAKDKVYQGVDLSQSDNNMQLIVFASQLERELLVSNHVDYIVSDSPLFLNAYYSKSQYLLQVAKDNNKEDDIHIWVERDANERFETKGRSHNERESKKIDLEMKKFLTEVCGLNLLVVKGTAKEKSNFISNYIIKQHKESVRNKEAKLKAKKEARRKSVKLRTMKLKAKSGKKRAK